LYIEQAWMSAGVKPPVAVRRKISPPFSVIARNSSGSRCTEDVQRLPSGVRVTGITASAPYIST